MAEALSSVPPAEYASGAGVMLACSSKLASSLSLQDAETLETGYRCTDGGLQIAPLEVYYNDSELPSIYIPPQIQPSLEAQFESIIERLVIAAKRSSGKTLKTSKNKKKRRHANIYSFPTELLFKAHERGLVALKATKGKLTVTSSWDELVADKQVFQAKYNGSKRYFELGGNRAMTLHWGDSFRLNASCDLEVDINTDSDGNIVVSKLHTEKGHQALNLPRPKRTELGQFK